MPRARRIRGCQAWIPEHRLERAIAGELNLAQMRDVVRAERQQQDTLQEIVVAHLAHWLPLRHLVHPGVQPIGVLVQGIDRAVTRRDQARPLRGRKIVRESHQAHGVQVVAAARSLTCERRIQPHRLRQVRAADA